MKKFNSILLIDDDFATNEFHKIIINHANVAEHIYAVESGEEALSYLISEDSTHVRPDLIFLDINMPAMNGFEFIEEYDKIQEDQKGKYLIVMLTSSLNPDDKERAEKNIHINNFLSKPLTKDNLLKLRDQYLI